MNVSRMGRRLATAGIASALAAGAMVGAGSTAANAVDSTKTGTSTYTCTFPMIGDQQVPVDITIPNVSGAFPTIPAGLPLGMGSLNASYVFHANPTVAALLPQVTGLGSSDLSLLLGSNVVKVANLALGTPTPGTEPGSLDIPGTGTNGDFSVPGAGVYDLTLPQTFHLTGSSALGAVNVPCTTATPAVLDTLTVVKNDSFTALKAPAQIAKGKVAKLVATITGGANIATGKVVFKDGSTKLGTATVDSTGKAVYKAKGLSVGKHKITAAYSGDDFRNKSKSPASVVKVVK